jgi:hypothetical protein
MLDPPHESAHPACAFENGDEGTDRQGKGEHAGVAWISEHVDDAVDTGRKRVCRIGVAQNPPADHNAGEQRGQHLARDHREANRDNGRHNGEPADACARCFHSIRSRGGGYRGKASIGVEWRPRSARARRNRA